MADDLIAAELDAVREYERRATAGPWKAEREHLYDMDDAPFSLPSVTGPDGQEIFGGSVDQPGADLRFAARARTDIPRLLAALDAVLERHAPTATTRYTEPCKVHRHDIFGRRDCKDCRKVSRNGCETCRDEFGRPAKPEDCKERAAILAALIVKGKNSDGA